MPLAKLILVATISLVLASPLDAAESLNEAFILQELQRSQAEPDSLASVTIAAPIEFVFDFLASRPNDYTADADSVEFDHSGSEFLNELGSGSIRVITMESGETLSQRFLLMERPATYAYLTDMEKSTVSLPLKYSIARYELSEVAGGITELRVTLVYEPSSRLLAFFVRRAFRSALQRDFEKAAELIEAEWKRETQIL